MTRKKGTFAFAPVRNLMKAEGATVVSRAAVEALLSFLEEKVKSVTSTALKLCEHAKRKKVTKADVLLALKA